MDFTGAVVFVLAAVYRLVTAHALSSADAAMASFAALWAFMSSLVGEFPETVFDIPVAVAFLVMCAAVSFQVGRLVAIIFPASIVVPRAAVSLLLLWTWYPVVWRFQRTKARTMERFDDWVDWLCQDLDEQRRTRAVAENSRKTYELTLDGIASLKAELAALTDRCDRVWRKLLRYDEQREALRPVPYHEPGAVKTVVIPGADLNVWWRLIRLADWQVDLNNAATALYTSATKSNETILRRLQQENFKRQGELVKIEQRWEWTRVRYGFRDAPPRPQFPGMITYNHFPERRTIQDEIRDLFTDLVFEFGHRYESDDGQGALVTASSHASCPTTTATADSCAAALPTPEDVDTQPDSSESPASVAETLATVVVATPEVNTVAAEPDARFTDSHRPAVHAATTTEPLAIDAPVAPAVDALPAPAHDPAAVYLDYLAAVAAQRAAEAEMQRKEEERRQRQSQQHAEYLEIMRLETQRHQAKTKTKQLRIAIMRQR